MAHIRPIRSCRTQKYLHDSSQRMRSENNSTPYAVDAECQSAKKRRKQKTNSIFDYIAQRQTQTVYRNPLELFSYEIASHMPEILQEREYSLGRINKIFASKWINNDKQVVLGTKCNQVLVMDVDTGRRTQIPSLPSSNMSTPAPSPCGIHSITINPSQTLLATGASNTNDIAVYKLPTFDPVCVGELGHTDWIFDLQWIDDEYLVSGSRDGCMALWKMNSKDDGKPSRLSSLFIPEYAVKEPLIKKSCTQADRIRALAFNQASNQVAAISLNGFFHMWDMESFVQLFSKSMSGKEHVCLAYNDRAKVYAIGSQSHVSLFDVRTPYHPKSFEYTAFNFNPIESAYKEKGVRSVGFNNDIITIGTGAGTMFFYDMRAKKYIKRRGSCAQEHHDSRSLRMGKGWLRSDDSFRELFLEYTYPNAVYTHCYDSSNTRLFAAGGPLPSGLWGNYAGLWL